MIVKNEEHTIAACLDSIREIPDEIVIVDTGSSDRTKELASRYTDRIYDFEWIDNFAAARNYAFSLATMEYILWLDADDQLFDKDKQKLLELKKSLDPAVDSVAMEYHLAFDHQGNPAKSCRRNRLVKRINNYKWMGAVHEFLFLGEKANILYSDIAVSHVKVAPIMQCKMQRNLHIYEKLIAIGEQLSPRDKFLYADELMFNGFYDRAIEQYIQCLDEAAAGVQYYIEACSKLASYYHQKGDRKKELHYLFKSFEYDLPQAEHCCLTGNYFFSHQRWNIAIFWYSLALQLERPKDAWGLINLYYYTWYPHLQLAICYGKLGMLEHAYHHNEIAHSYLPDDSAVLNNKQILEKHLHPQGEGKQG
ncbi:tetratricopeptide repeat-containing glycosyltransferase family 2 protein [Paenibacillus popilliae]|uniref:Glycosyltransferase n=1 Tax=Paenibacillus popilliae ATCC 14706 TaxID=1212764 RepID=M9M8B8_PAEPP|nr:glycosyltransferase family 2 protein [Paenibacillus popilliae]GAC44153.1 glycosyltransferase [Paenibacillus popilliae ATCC 14706]